MCDDDMIEPFSIQEVYCDGVAHIVADGMLTATAYRICRQNGRCEKIAVARLVLKIENAMESMADARKAISAPLVMVTGERLGHH
jgi:hypothetical protein